MTPLVAVAGRDGKFMAASIAHGLIHWKAVSLEAAGTLPVKFDGVVHLFAREEHFYF